MMMGYGLGSGGILMLAFWVFVIAGLVWLVLTLSRSQAPVGDGRSTALRILEERLARGEIDADDFKTRRALIDGTSK